MPEVASAAHATEISLFDQRREKRRPTSNTAAIVTNTGQEPIEAVIVDRSENGAKLELLTDPYLPKFILVADLSTNSVFECEVRWRAKGHIGVQIIDTYGPGRRRRFLETHTLSRRARSAR